MSYSVENLRKLRSLTEAGIGECIKALNASNNDLPRALKWLGERSLSFSKSSRFEPSEKLNKFGLVKINNARNKIVAFSLKCESDFVAMNAVFTRLADDIAVLLMERFEYLVNYSHEQINKELAGLINNASYSLNERIYIEKTNFFLKEESEVFAQYTHYNARVAAFVILNSGSEKVARELAMQAVANSPVFLTIENIPHQVISARLEQIRQRVSKENPNRESAIIERIVNGTLNKWVSEVCFLEQKDFRDPGRKIKEILHSANTSIKNLFLIGLDS